jgi:hypothetical protein
MSRPADEHSTRCPRFSTNAPHCSSEPASRVISTHVAQPPAVRPLLVRQPVEPSAESLNVTLTAGWFGLANTSGGPGTPCARRAHEISCCSRSLVSIVFGGGYCVQTTERGGRTGSDSLHAGRPRLRMGADAGAGGRTGGIRERGKAGLVQFHRSQPGRDVREFGRPNIRARRPPETCVGGRPVHSRRERRSLGHVRRSLLSGAARTAVSGRSPAGKPRDHAHQAQAYT